MSNNNSTLSIFVASFKPVIEGMSQLPAYAVASGIVTRRLLDQYGIIEGMKDAAIIGYHLTVAFILIVEALFWAIVGLIDFGRYLWATRNEEFYIVNSHASERQIPNFIGHETINEINTALDECLAEDYSATIVKHEKDTAMVEHTYTADMISEVTNRFTIRDLKHIAKTNGVGGDYGRMRKAALAELLVITLSYNTVMEQTSTKLR